MKTSIVILTRNQLEVTASCLESIRRHTPEPHEIIIVDNGSTDGTPDYIRLYPDIILHENQENVGFAIGCNQGTALASGDYVLFLNNDTVVTKGWLTHMLRVMESEEDAGMVGPVSNFTSGHQRIAVSYTELSQLDAFAEAYTASQAGNRLQVRRLIGFCLLARRSMLEEIGGFDERYRLGNYEDDDLCLRAIRQGYTLHVALDAFVHHYGHVTMAGLESDTLSSLLQENGQRAIEKWGAPIHELIYRAPIRISLCVLAGDDVRSLHHTLASSRGVADELIVMVPQSQSLSPEQAAAAGVPSAQAEITELAKQYTASVYSYSGGDETPEEAYRFGYDLASCEFVLWLHAGDGLEQEERRRLAGLKLAVDEGVEAIELACGEQERRYMVRRSTGFISPAELAGSSTAIAWIEGGVKVSRLQ
ncbi:glycosyltransferase family 2 protein [Paenibacillus sp. SYP-B4298]|uniref:glycosyltransferase family 2 protein n=1 Tax=Paenibacillus sp. SYP-B4298 TaxID=2996034 RepID=UPI0022DDC954|nr:glycosyltransferase family 2 protein [Paenibacillus sp. SYP-B4298]